MKKKYSNRLLGIALILILAGVNVNLFAAEKEKEKAEKEEKEVPKFNIGIFLGYTMAVNQSNIPIGRKSALAFDDLPDFGIKAYYPLSDEMEFGALLELGYGGYAYGVKDVATDKVYKHAYTYIGISPTILFKGWIFGINYLMPQGGDMEGVEIEKGKLSPTVEMKFGYEYILFEDKSSIMASSLKLGYMLGGIYNNFLLDDPLTKEVPLDKSQVTNNGFNPQALSINLAFSYSFNF